MASNTAEIVIKANSRQLPAGLATAMTAMRGFARGVQAIMGAAARAPLNVARQVAHEVGREMVWGMTRRGMDALIEQGHEVLNFREALGRLGLAARKTPQELSGIEAAVRSASNATGLGALEILKGTRAYVDIAGAERYTTEKMELLARVAQASGSKINDLAQVMYQLQHAMKIPDEQLESTFSGLLNMSKDGTIHFAQMAEEINELAPQFARFGVTGRDGMMQLAAMMQITRAGFASVAETGTGMTRIFQGLNMHSDKFENYGVRIFNVGKNGVKTFRPFLDILNDIQRNNVLSKDPHLLRKAFGRGEAERGMRLLFEGRQEMERFVRAGEEAGAITQDLGTYTASASGRIAIAMEKAKNAIAEAMTPDRVERMTGALEGMVAKIDTIMEGVGKLTDAFMYLYNVGRRIREAFSDIDDANPFKKEADAANERLRAYSPVHRSYSYRDASGRYLVRPEITETPATQAEQEQAERDRRSVGDAAQWHVAAKRIMALSPGDVPTEASIRAAYAASKEMLGASPNLGAQAAGSMFLSNAPPAMVDKIIKAIHEEERYAPRKAYSEMATAIADAVSKAIENTPARVQAERRYRELYGKDPPAGVHMDGHKVGNVIKNTGASRRSP